MTIKKSDNVVTGFSNTHIKIAKSYIINLPERPERLERAKKVLISMPYLEKIDGVIIKSKKFNKRKRGAIGCALAHLNVLKLIKLEPETDNEGNRLWYCIFEDDINTSLPYDTLYNTQIDILSKLPEDAKLINFGLNHNFLKLRSLLNMIDGKKVNTKIGNGYTSFAHSYAIRPKMASECISIINKWLEDYQNNIINHEFDHEWGIKLQKDDMVFCTHLFFQSDFGSDIRLF
jgi:GR25 family glycosyltransferase involved in LPS biosynthesis